MNILNNSHELYYINLQNEEHDFKCLLGFTNLDLETLNIIKERFLHPYELTEYGLINNNLRQKSYISGRYIAKQVILEYTGESKLTKIQIRNGYFGQPYIVYGPLHTVDISLTHNDQYAACLVFPRHLIMAIDMQLITDNSRENMISQTTEWERQLLPACENENLFYTVLWTIKESLSKVVKTGLLTSFDLFEVNKLKKLNGYYIGYYKHFSQYKAISFHWQNNIFSIVIPESLQCCFTINKINISI